MAGYGAFVKDEMTGALRKRNACRGTGRGGPDQHWTRKGELPAV